MLKNCLILLTLIFLVLTSDQAQKKINQEWNYDTLGPDYWKANFANSCGNGKKQSPINIETRDVVESEQLKPIKFNNYDKEIEWIVTNNGHTIVALPVHKRNIKSFPISINGSNFRKNFFLVQFHFHWGFNDYQGSEHRIDYEKFPLEMHLLHKSSDGTVAVLGFLFRLDLFDNPTLDSLIDVVSYDSIISRTKVLKFSLGSILPKPKVLSKMGYYRYLGSLTTPPCTETIIWTIFKAHIPISSSQLKVFRNNSVLANFRDDQPLYGRQVFSSIDE